MTAKLSDEACREALEAVARYGGVRQAAQALGINYSKLRHRVETAQRRGLMTDPGVSTAMDTLGLDQEPELTWIKTKNDDGVSYSVLMKKKRVDYDDPDQLLQRMEEGLSFILDRDREYPAYTKRSDCREDLLGLLHIPDVHFGMYAWGEETGFSDYDLPIASDRLITWVTELVEDMPGCGLAILHYNGDTIHTEDDENRTRRSGNALDKDTRQSKVVFAAIESIITTVDIALRKHDRVKLVVKRGNHDEGSHLAILVALKYHFKDHPRVDVDPSPSEFWCYRWYDVLLWSHHGDKASAEQLVMALAARYPEDWGFSRYRFVLTGHRHHYHERRVEGATCIQSSSVCVPDAHSAGAAYGDHSELRAQVFEKGRGLRRQYIVS